MIKTLFFSVGKGGLALACPEKHIRRILACSWPLESLDHTTSRGMNRANRWFGDYGLVLLLVYHDRYFRSLSSSVGRVPASAVPAVYVFDKGRVNTIISRSSLLRVQAKETFIGRPKNICIVPFVHGFKDSDV